MANQKEVICWEYTEEPNKEVKIICMGVKIHNLLGEAYTEDEQLIEIDTGYDGNVLIPFNAFIELGLNRWELEPKVGITVTGEEIEIIPAHGLLSIPRLNLDFPIIIETSEDTADFLLGLGFIKKFKLLLNGIDQKSCILEWVH